MIKLVEAILHILMEDETKEVYWSANDIVNALNNRFGVSLTKRQINVVLYSLFNEGKLQKICKFPTSRPLWRLLEESSTLAVLETQLSLLNGLFQREHTYSNWLKWITLRIYLNQMLDATDYDGNLRYTLQELEDFDVIEAFKQPEVIVEAEEAIVEVSSLYDTEHNTEELKKLLDKYRGHYSLLFQRMYRKYVDKNYTVDDTETLNDADVIYL